MSAHNVWDITCFDPLPWSTFAWIVMNLSTIFVYLFGSYFIYLIWIKMEKSGTIISIIRCICTTLVVLFMLAAIQWSIHVTSSFYCIYDFQLWLDLGLVALLCYQLGLALLYLIFVIRLSYTFKGTSFAISPRLFIILIIGLIMQICFACLVMIFFYGYPPQEWKWANMTIFLFQFTNLFFTIILLSVFFKKIVVLQDEALLKSAVRLTICASTGLLSSNLVSVISVVRFFYGDGEIIWTSHVMFLALDQCVNLFSIYLQFPFGSKVFDKMCGEISSYWQQHVVDVKNIEIGIHSTTKATSHDVTKTNISIANDVTKTADLPGIVSKEVVLS